MKEGHCDDPVRSSQKRKLGGFLISPTQTPPLHIQILFIKAQFKEYSFHDIFCNLSSYIYTQKQPMFMLCFQVYIAFYSLCRT